MNRHWRYLFGLTLGVAFSCSASERPTLKDYRTAKQELIKNFGSFDMGKRTELYQAAEKVSRIAWSGLQPKLIDKREARLGNSNFAITFYDYDKDRVADQFRLNTLDGKNLPQDFGFIYDLDGDRRADYIVYFGGTMITNNGDIYYYFYHWLDTDRDGKIDAIANSIFIHPDENRPDPKCIFWVIDSDKDGKPDYVGYIEKASGESVRLQSEKGVWRYNTLFGSKEISADNDAYFSPYTNFLTAVNGNSANGKQKP